jgi:nucleotide-binding universal stress UspA family protein
MTRVFPFAVAAALFGLAGCFKAPEIVMVDRATALEQQASGSFDDLERQLDRAGIEPRPVPLTPEQLESLGIRPAPLVDESDLTDADRLDGLLAQHCIGEGKGGLLVDTRSACKGAADPEEVRTLVERANRARRQLWRWMHEQRADVSEGEMQRAWRANHVPNIVCGGWVEGSDGKWQEKAC